MPKIKANSIKYFFIFLIIFLTTNQEDSLYNFPIEILGQHYLPMIPIYFKEYSSLPKLMLLDINIDKSWIFKFESNNDSNSQINKENIKHDFYTVLGHKKSEKLYLNSNTIIEKFIFLSVNQIKGDNNFPGVLSLNKKMNEFNIVNKLEYKENKIMDNKYFGFCLDFNNRKNNEAKLSIGDLFNLNKDISKLTRIPLYEEKDEEEKKNKEEINYSKWAIKLNGLFIGKINKNITENNTFSSENNENKIIYKINKKQNKGLIIDEAANIETIYNSIYVTKEAMLFLVANYFKDKDKICFRQEIHDQNNYEIKYNCLKSKKSKLNNINLILENNITLILTNDDLLNCAINHNMNTDKDNNDNKDENFETCEFNIKYHQKIDHYILGLSVFKKYKTYFLFNDNSILLEGDNFLNCYLHTQKFSNISRYKKKNIIQTIKELFNTTLCISFIFALLAGGFYVYEKMYGKIEYNDEDEAKTIINRNKYVNL